MFWMISIYKIVIHVSKFNHKLYKLYGNLVYVASYTRMNRGQNAWREKKNETIYLWTDNQTALLCAFGALNGNIIFMNGNSHIQCSIWTLQNSMKYSSKYWKMRANPAV